jgi:hypothetical protein
MSDMARIRLELGLRADANWFHDARMTTGNQKWSGRWESNPHGRRVRN